MPSVLKSIVAIVVGMLAGGIPQVLCDKLLESAGMINAQHLSDASTAIILGIIGYRILFNILGCYVCARIAPSAPMMHCMIIGALGTIGSLAATFSMPEAGPMWYGLSVAAISIPCAWLGARIAQRPQATTA